jgi:hypothetical protein
MIRYGKLTAIRVAGVVHKPRRAAIKLPIHDVEPGLGNGIVLGELFHGVEVGILSLGLSLPTFTLGGFSVRDYLSFVNIYKFTSPEVYGATQT